MQYCSAQKLVNATNVRMAQLKDNILLFCKQTEICQSKQESTCNA